jgi:hypothetical protein
MIFTVPHNKICSIIRSCPTSYIEIAKARNKVNKPKSNNQKLYKYINEIYININIKQGYQKIELYAKHIPGPLLGVM